MTITHITERESELQSKNDKLLRAVEIQDVTIAALRAELAALKAQHCEMHAFVSSQKDEINEMASELEASYADNGNKPIGYISKDGLTILYAGDVWPSGTPIYAAPVQPVHGLQHIHDAIMADPSVCDIDEPVAWLVTFENGEQELHFDKQCVGDDQVPLYAAPVKQARGDDK